MNAVNGKLTLVVDDVSGNDALKSEHGLAIWIEWGGRNVLFDAGQGGVLLENAQAMGIDLAKADAIVLSHGHYDHTGGLHRVLEIAEHPPVYAHPRALEPKYAAGSTSRSIGIAPVDRESLMQKAAWVEVGAPCTIAGGLRLTGPVPRETNFEDIGGPFYVDEACSQPDTIPDDQAAFLETPDGVVVILGCAHAGVINILRYVTKLTGQPIHTVVGGMHLLRADKQRMDATVSELRRLNLRRLVPCHCTGVEAMERLRREFPETCEIGRCGTVLPLTA